ncbi:MAG TPA: hypothetical protein VF752_11000 [Thermoleophilaceae bacterium]
MLGPQTRRELLRNGGIAIGVVGAARLGWLPADARATSAPLRRCVSLGANGVINPRSSQDYRRNRTFLLDTGTTWVRLWADWPSLQPEPSLAPDRGSGAWRLAELDKQIAQANADGVHVILCSYRFPTWANGTADLSPSEEVTYELPDRASAAGTSRKDLRFKLPENLGPTSAWAAWIRFLVKRYGPGSPSRKPTIAALEVCNEPNGQMWPLQRPSTTADAYTDGPLTVQTAVAQMFITAQGITAEFGSQPVLMGPATADSTGDSRLAVSYDTFTGALLDELTRLGFRAGPQFAWTHHNYTDVESDLGSGSWTGDLANGAAAVREMLRGRWAGWPSADASQPRVFMTEGGARLSEIANVYGSSDREFLLQRQAELIQRNWARMRSEREGAGIAMFAQYLFGTDASFDSGLCDPSGVKRPAYDAWKALPLSA